MPKLPLFWTEWNVRGMIRIARYLFVGPALANTIRAVRRARGHDVVLDVFGCI